MERRMRLGEWIVSILATCAAAFPTPLATGYDFTLVASSGQTISGKTLQLVCGPVINNSNHVAFVGSFADGNGIFTPFAKVVGTGDRMDTTVYTKAVLGQIGNAAILGTHCFVSMNNAGTVAYESSFYINDFPPPPTFGVFTNSQLLVSAGGPIRRLAVPVINDAGTVVFFAEGVSGSGLYTESGPLAVGGTLIGATTLLGVSVPTHAAIDKTGEVVFLGRFGGGTGVFTTSRMIAATGQTIGGKTLTGFEVAGSFDSLLNSPAIDSGRVAFVGTFAGGNGIFTPSRLIAGTGDVIARKVLTTLLAPAINKRGEVVFLGSFAGGSGLFTKSKLLIATGDAVGGKTITSLGPPNMNDHGSIVFAASFADGSTGIVFASRRDNGDDDGEDR